MFLHILQIQSTFFFFYIPSCTGIASAYYKWSNNILCGDSTTLGGEFLSRSYRLLNESHGNVAIDFKHHFTEWLLLRMSMWVGGWRARTRLFLLFLILSASSWPTANTGCPVHFGFWPLVLALHCQEHTSSLFWMCPWLPSPRPHYILLLSWGAHCYQKTLFKQGAKVFDRPCLKLLIPPLASSHSLFWESTWIIPAPSWLLLAPKLDVAL